MEQSDGCPQLFHVHHDLFNLYKRHSQFDHIQQAEDANRNRELLPRQLGVLYVTSCNIRYHVCINGFRQRAVLILRKKVLRKLWRAIPHGLRRKHYNRVHLRFSR